MCNNVNFLNKNKTVSFYSLSIDYLGESRYYYHFNWTFINIFEFIVKKKKKKICVPDAQLNHPTKRIIIVEATHSQTPLYFPNLV